MVACLQPLMRLTVTEPQAEIVTVHVWGDLRSAGSRSLRLRAPVGV